MSNVASSFRRLVSVVPCLPNSDLQGSMNTKDPGKLADCTACYVDFLYEDKRKQLEQVCSDLRLKVLDGMLD